MIIKNMSANLITTSMFDAYNIKIEIEATNVKILINKNSDLCLCYSILKIFLNWNEYGPQSIYMLKSDNSKIKKNFNKFKFFDIWQFLNYTVESESATDSELSNITEIIGWEVRFILNFSAEEANNQLAKSFKGYEGIIQTFKKLPNDS